MNYRKHLIGINESVRDALIKLEFLSTDAILFLIDSDEKLIGSITDGDIRRGLIKDLSLEDPLISFIQANPKHIRIGKDNFKEVIELRKKNYLVFPVIDENNIIVNVINFRYQKSYLPVDVLIMAGGRGERLRPLTDSIPKPLLKVKNKPIIEHNIDRLILYGINNFWISVCYLGKQIEDYFNDGSKKSVSIRYIYENIQLGTIGALSLIESFSHESILIMNSDLLTNIDFEEFYNFFIDNEADFAVACFQYNLNIPYAVMSTNGVQVNSFTEKPTYTYYSNAGIYLIKKSLIDLIPKKSKYDATNLITDLIALKKKVVAFPLIGYWRDIGTHDDYQKANDDFNNIVM